MAVDSALARARELADRVDPAASRDGEDVPRGLIWTLGVGVLGLTWSLTTVAAYLPPVLHEFTHSRLVIGAVLSGEGIVAALAPLVVGPLSDRTRSRLGRRRPYMLAALPVMVAALCAVALVPSLAAIVAVLAVFFVAYYVYETPYRSLYADLLPPEIEGRAQSVQHLLRGGAIGLALVLGGILLAAWQPLPFVLAAGVVVASGVAVTWRVRERKRPRRRDGGALAPFRIVRENAAVRRFLVANTAWEATFAGMRTFVVLYIVQGLGQPLYVSSVVLGVVAAGYVVAAAGVGRLADRVGAARVVLVACVVYGAGLAGGVFPGTWRWVYLVLVFVVAVAAGTVMTLAWSLLYKVMPEADRGSSAGLASMTKGIGLLVGPAVTGLAIDLARGVFEATDGYAVMWPVLAAPILVSIPFVARLRGDERDG